VIIMDLRKCDNSALIRCEDEECRGATFRYALEKNGWHCPFCGTLISQFGGHTNRYHSLLDQWLYNGFKFCFSRFESYGRGHK
jgi:hypothetical protein